MAVHGSGLGCRECSIGSTDARNLVAATAFGFLVFVLCIALGWWRYTRPSVMEERFIDAFRGIEDGDASKMVGNFFGVEIGSGIAKDVFVTAVIRQCGGNSNDSTRCRIWSNNSTYKVATIAAKRHALNLWSKLDEDKVRPGN